MTTLCYLAGCGFIALSGYKAKSWETVAAACLFALGTLAAA